MFPEDCLGHARCTALALGAGNVNQSLLLLLLFFMLCSSAAAGIVVVVSIVLQNFAPIVSHIANRLDSSFGTLLNGLLAGGLVQRGHEGVDGRLVELLLLLLRIDIAISIRRGRHDLID